MFDESLPSKEDLELLSKLDKQGDGLLEDLFSIFSYHRPKEYKLYVENIEYNPLDKGKIILDLIFTIQKYNKLVKKEMESFHQKGENNKYFSDLYKGAKYFWKSVTSKTCGEVLNNLIPRYAEKHLRFENKFLNKNIFKNSGLLPNNLKHEIEFFDSEVRKNGVNSYKNFKYIKFIEKLYKSIQKTFKRQTINSTLMLFESPQDNLYQQKQEKKMKQNMERMRKKEIALEKEEIENLKMLNDIANVTYQKIMKSINNRKLKKKTKKIPKNKKGKSKSKSKNNKINTSQENEQQTIKEDNNIKTNEKFEEMLPESKFNTRYNKKYNRTLSMERMSNATFFNNNHVTSTTRFIDSKNNTLSNNFTLYNVHKDLLNKLNNLKIKKEREKEKEKAIFKPFQIYTKTFTRNKSEPSIFPYISQKSVNDKNKQIKLMINPVLNSTTNNFKILKSSGSSPMILNLNSKDIDIEIKEKKEIPHKKLTVKRISIKKKEKPTKLDLLAEHHRKVPIIYEKLRKIKNLLNMSRRDTTQSSKVLQLFSELYGKKVISDIDGKKAPKELYNSFFNLRLAIERKSQTGSIFKKYMNMLDKSLENKLEKSKEQDEKLKTKYYDLAEVMVKKQLEKENEIFQI